MPFESDWALVRAALPELKEYVISKDLYRPLSGVQKPGSAEAPQLTIGNLLLSLKRLSAGPQEAEAAQMSQQIDAVRQEWRTNWSRKAAREFASRLNLWQQYLSELRADPRGQAPFYASEVRQRAVLQLLRPEILEVIPSHEEDQLAMLDALVRGLTRQGEFVWEAEAAPAFPREDFWFLYVHFTQQQG